MEYNGILILYKKVAIFIYKKKRGMNPLYLSMNIIKLQLYKNLDTQKCNYILIKTYYYIFKCPKFLEVSIF